MSVQSSLDRHPRPAARDIPCSSFLSGLSWFDKLAPEGIPVPSSILLTGPSGIGKPFVGLALAASWLQQGGRVIFVPLHRIHAALFKRGLRNAAFRDEAVAVPGQPDFLEELKNEAVSSRRILIPAVSGI